VVRCSMRVPNQVLIRVVSIISAEALLWLERFNESAKPTAEFSPGWSERSERNPGIMFQNELKPAKRAAETSSVAR
jgi:hypothetical protein